MRAGVAKLLLINENAKTVSSDPDGPQHKKWAERYIPVQIIRIFWKFNPEVKKKKTQEKGNDEETKTATFHLQHKHYFVWLKISKRLGLVRANKPSAFEENKTFKLGRRAFRMWNTMTFWKKISQYSKTKQEK